VVESTQYPKCRKSAQYTTKPRLLGAKQLLLHILGVDYFWAVEVELIGSQYVDADLAVLGWCMASVNGVPVHGLYWPNASVRCIVLHQVN